MARNIPAGTKPGQQSPTNRTTISESDRNGTNSWGGNSLILQDWAWWDVYEYDQDEYIYGPCSKKLQYSIQETKTWSLSATGGVSMGGSGGISGEHANVGVNWAMNQGFGYAETGAISVTLSGEVPAKEGYRPVLIIQYRVKEYDIDYYDYHWVSFTKHIIKIKFKTVVGIDHGYIPCE